MGAKYLIRLDDACFTMNKHKWEKFEMLLDKFGIKPIVAVIPNNKNEKLLIDPPDSFFWDTVRRWQKKNWVIALHGFDHVFISYTRRSLVPINNYSEFAGIDLQLQKEKIKKGIAIFQNEGIKPLVWVAPAHSFDKNTLRALKEESDIRIISDGFAYTPFYSHGFLWIPQQFWKFIKRKQGVWTGCFHPNTISDNDFTELANFINVNYKDFVLLDEINQISPRRTIGDRAYHYYTFFKERIKRIKSKYLIK